MKRTLIIILILIVTPHHYARADSEWTRETVFKAKYGENVCEYGYTGIVQSADTSPIGALFVAERHIYIFDRTQSNVKEYDYEGNFIRAIPVGVLSGTREYSPNAHEILVHNNVLYLLCQPGGIPPVDQSQVRVLMYDLESGLKLDYLEIYNPNVSRMDGDKAYTVGATGLRIGIHDSVWIYDSTHDNAIMIVKSGKVAHRSHHRVTLEGEPFGTFRIVRSEDGSIISKLAWDGSNLNDISICKPKRHRVNPTLSGSYSSRDGSYLVYKIFMAPEFIILKEFTILTKIIIEKMEAPFLYGSGMIFHVDYEGRFYRLFAGKDGVYLYRWSGK